jgi:hypothetical protein
MDMACGNGEFLTWAVIYANICTVDRRQSLSRFGIVRFELRQPNADMCNAAKFPDTLVENNAASAIDPSVLTNYRHGLFQPPSLP